MNKTKETYNKYILCSDRREALKRLDCDIPVLTSYYGRITVRSADCVIKTNDELRHYIYPENADGIENVNELEVDTSAIQSLPIKELMTYISIFKINICLTKERAALSNKIIGELNEILEDK